MEQPKYSRNWFIYTLALEDGKFYVGMTTNIERRFRQHSNGMGAKFTRRYKPIRIHSYKFIGFMNTAEAAKYEDARAAELIAIVGQENCSGGSFITSYQKKKVTKKYLKLDNKYKNIEKIVNIKRAAKPKGVKGSPWIMMEARATIALNESSRLI